MFYKGQLLTYKRLENCHTVLPIFMVTQTTSSVYVPIVVINYHAEDLIGTNHNIHTKSLKPLLTIGEL